MGAGFLHPGSPRSARGVAAARRSRVPARERGLARCARRPVRASDTDFISAGDTERGARSDPRVCGRYRLPPAGAGRCRERPEPRRDEQPFRPQALVPTRGRGRSLADSSSRSKYVPPRQRAGVLFDGGGRVGPPQAGCARSRAGFVRQGMKAFHEDQESVPDCKGVDVAGALREGIRVVHTVSTSEDGSAWARAASPRRSDYSSSRSPGLPFRRAPRPRFAFDS